LPAAGREEALGVSGEDEEDAPAAGAAGQLRKLLKEGGSGYRDLQTVAPPPSFLPQPPPSPSPLPPFLLTHNPISLAEKKFSQLSSYNTCKAEITASWAYPSLEETMIRSSPFPALSYPPKKPPKICTCL